MKAILEFDLTDSSERKAHKRAISATDAYLVLAQYDDYFRNKLKYIELTDGEFCALQEARSKLFELLSDYSINLNDLE
jgi:hypothetical protein